MMLGEFLREAGRDAAPWNCSTMPADWCILLGHLDFAAEWRGTTRPEECEAAPARAGGLAILWDRAIRDAMPEAVAPFAIGDVGVIAVHGLEVGAIFTGDKWAARTGTGVSFVRLPDSAIAAAWRP